LSPLSPGRIDLPPDSQAKTEERWSDLAPPDPQAKGEEESNISPESEKIQRPKSP